MDMNKRLNDVREMKRKAEHDIVLVLRKLEREMIYFRVSDVHINKGVNLEHDPLALKVQIVVTI